MARQTFGDGIADFVVQPTDGLWGVAAGTTVTFWNSSTDGEQYTDLLDPDGTPVTAVTSDDYGALPSVQGPEGILGMWADAGGGRRAWLYAQSGGRGLPGDPGAHWYFGTGEPEDSDLTPVAGDLYVDTSNGNLYSYTGTEWLYQTGLRGPEGPAGTGNVESVNGKTGDIVLTATDVGAIPAASKGAAGGVPDLDPTGKVPAEQLPAPPAVPGIWLPSDYGLAGWAYDLHAASRTPGDMPGQAQRLYLIGVPLRTAKTVSQVAIHVMGYDQSASTTTNVRFGIYDASFALRASSAGDQKAQLPAVHNIGGQMVKLNLSTGVSLSAGLYYVAILVKVSATTATPYLAATNWGATSTTSGAVAVSTGGVHRWLQSSATNLTALPASGTLTAASFTEATTCYWAGIV
ncbi:hypothetical protein [Streptomyces corynorhini]|uniref:Minor tail protein n=1 Tax=Streptomyces corynorhini TaxID=2282652 RepID=A0A370B8M1_9ACTN|nr:hypothetical protein [Streptomyces corynorhini]RDG37971.1 hypothetical protein DVH02_11650 [Streptomyces corynorhini]